MGTNPIQPLTLVCSEDKPYFYLLNFDLKDLNVLNVNSDIDWAMLIAYFRGYFKGYETSKIYQKYSNMCNGYDVILGYIADDRMYHVLTDFFEQRITDVALISSLSVLDLGRQYVAKSQKACEKIKIVEYKKISKLELLFLMDFTEKRRNSAKLKTDRLLTKFRREGKFFDEILEENI